MEIKKGQVVWVDLNNEETEQKDNKEQVGKRPCIIVQNDTGNRFSSTTIVVPLTSSFSKTRLPIHVNISKDFFAGTQLKDSKALCEQVRVIDKKRIIWKEKCILPNCMMDRINRALLISFGYGEEKAAKVVEILLNCGVGSEQSSNEPMPAIVIQNAKGNEHSPTLIIAPLVMDKRKRMLPTQVVIPGEQVGPNFKDSVALLEQVRVIDKSRVTNVYDDTNLSQDVTEGIERALLISLGIEPK